jgi:hypothetical protein
MTDLFFADLVRETTTGTGTAPLPLAGAAPGHRSFADAVPPGSHFHYTVAGITHEDQWEVGEGEIAANTLIRHQVLASSADNAPVDFAPGLKIVTLTVAADWFSRREVRNGHDHGIDQVTGLQAQLDGKQPSGSYAAALHAHAITDVSGLQAALDGKQPQGSYAPAVHGHDGLAALSGTAAQPSISFATDGDTGIFRPGADAWAISTGGVERVRVNPDGRLGIGIASPLGRVHVAWSGFDPGTNAIGAVVVDGAYGGGLVFRDSGSVAGLWTSDYGGTLNIGLGSGSLVAQLQLQTSALQPATDSLLSLGRADRRWSQLYASDGTIQTSDQRDKHWIGAPDAAEMAAGQAILQELGLFQWTAARAAKGPDAARRHFGVRAQNAFAALTGQGLDWRRYGWCCHDQWQDEDGVQERFGIRPDELALFLLAVLARQVADLAAAIETPDAGA